MFILLLQYDESKISQLIKIVSKVINVFSFQFMFCVQNRGKKEKWLFFFKFGAERGETEKKNARWRYKFVKYRTYPRK
jgi:hypothetical protein